MKEMYNGEYLGNDDDMFQKHDYERDYQRCSQSSEDEIDQKSYRTYDRYKQTKREKIEQPDSQRPSSTQALENEDILLNHLIANARDSEDRRQLEEYSDRTCSPFQYEYDRREADLENEIIKVDINGNSRRQTNRRSSISSRGTRVSQSADISRYKKKEDSISRPNKEIYHEAIVEDHISGSERGLDQERFPSYLSPKYINNGEDLSDVLSTNSVATENSPPSSTIYKKRNRIRTSSDASYPYSPTNSIRSFGPTEQLSSRKNSKNPIYSSSLDVGTGSVDQYTPGYQQDSTLEPHRRRSSSRTDQNYVRKPSLSNHVKQRQRLSVTSPSSPKAQHSTPKEEYNGTRSPRHSGQTNGQRKSRTSVTSRQSGQEDISRLARPRDTKPSLTSESGIHMQSNLSSPKASIRSRKSSSGRASVSSRISDAKRNTMGDTDSIGSATSIIMRTQSSASKSSGAKSVNNVDQDDEILVGDEKDLHDATRRGDIEVVEQLLTIGTDINCRNETDRTPIHWAAGNGHTVLLKFMLDNDANTEAADKFGMNALLWAAWFGHKDCIKILLRAGAKPSAKNKNGYTFLHCAAQNNHLMVEHILKDDLQEFDRNATDDGGRTCLHIVAKHGRKELLEKFIELECDINAKDKAENTPLHLAAKYGFSDLISILVKAGANIEDITSEQKTPLHLAAEEGQCEAIEELIKLDADVNAETEDEVCPLHLAVSGGHEAAAIALINAGADVDAGNKHNQTPLHYAVIGNRLALVQILVMHNADPNVQDARQETPLHLAAENGNLDITETILQSKVNLSLTDQRGKTALDVAARGSFITIVDMILKAERHHLYLKTSENHLGFNGHTSRRNDMDELDFPDGLDRTVSFKPDNSAETQHIRDLLFKLAHKYLKKDEWRKLAFQWGFRDSQVRAIEEEYTGEKSYKQHGYRMLLIWLNGCTLRQENPVKSLFEGLVGIQKRDVAELVRARANSLQADKSCVIS